MKDRVMTADELQAEADSYLAEAMMIENSPQFQGMKCQKTLVELNLLNASIREGEARLARFHEGQWPALDMHTDNEVVVFAHKLANWRAQYT